MKKVTKLILIIVILIAYGFINGLLIPKSGSSTLMGCPCEDSLGNKSFTGERPCNSVSSDKSYFSFIGILDLHKSERGSEIIECENGKQIGSRTDLSNSTVKYSFQFNSPLIIIAPILNAFKGIGDISSFIQVYGLLIITIILIYLVIKKL